MAEGPGTHCAYARAAAQVRQGIQRYDIMENR